MKKIKYCIMFFLLITLIVSTTFILNVDTKNKFNNEVISAGTEQTLDFSFFEIEDVKLGAYFSLILTKSKEVYYIGDILKTTGYLQLSSQHYNKIEIPDGEVPKAITVAVRSAYVLTESGTIYGMGRNTSGELGVPIVLDENNQDMRNEFVKVSSNANFTNVGVSAIYGGRKKLVILKNSILYAIGYNENGILAVGSLEDKISTPTKIVDGNGFTNDGTENIVHLSAMGYHTIMSLDKDNDNIAETLYGFGRNIHYQILGRDNGPSNITEPTFILDTKTFLNGEDTLENSNFGIEDVAIGDIHTTFKTNNGYVYTMSSEESDYNCINQGYLPNNIPDLGIGLPRLYRVNVEGTPLKAKTLSTGLYMTSILGVDNIVYSCSTNHPSSLNDSTIPLFGSSGTGSDIMLVSSPGIQEIYSNSEIGFENGVSEVTEMYSGNRSTILKIGDEFYGWGNTLDNLYGLNEYNHGETIGLTTIDRIFYKNAFKITGTALEHNVTKGIIYTSDVTLTDASNKTSEILLYEDGGNPISKKAEYDANSNQFKISVNNNEEKKFTIEVKDTTTGNVSKKFEFIIDKKPPRIEITNFESKCNLVGDIYYCNKDIDINISDLSAFISLKKDNVDFGDIVQNNLSDNLILNGEQEIIIYVIKDRAGLESVLKIILGDTSPRMNID